MRQLIFAFLAAFVFALAPAAAQTDVSGDWEVTVETPQGPMPATLTLKQDGTTLTGTISSPQGDLEAKGTIEGSVISMTMDFSGPQGAMTILMTAEVAGVAMKGELDFGQGTAPFYGKRK